MKKILLLLIFCIGFMGSYDFSFAECGKYEAGKTVSENLEECIAEGKTNLVQVEDNAKIEGGFKTKINGWTNNIALFLGILAVGSVIYGGLMMTLSAGEEEKIKKAKDIVKWGLIGFLGVVMATTIVTLVINVMYGLAT